MVKFFQVFDSIIDFLTVKNWRKSFWDEKKMNQAENQLKFIGHSLFFIFWFSNAKLHF